MDSISKLMAWDPALPLPWPGYPDKICTCRMYRSDDDDDGPKWQAHCVLHDLAQT